MILNLKFQLQFTTTEKVYTAGHDFQTGMTAITGRNEAGKSLRVEMIRYCLFGSEALRSDAKNYKAISASLKFKVGDAIYTVERQKGKALISKNGVNIATGTTPVNSFILKLLGYDLEVFDIANACLQGEVEAMTNKRPGERKQMVDRTIGLNAIDEVMKKVQDDVSATKKAVEALNERVIQVYEQPIPPNGLDESYTLEGLEKSLEVLDKLNQRKSYITGLIDNARAPEPQAPVLPDTGPETLEELEKQLSDLEINYASMGETRIKYDTYLRASQAVGNLDKALIKKAVKENYDQKWVQYEAYEKARVNEPIFSQADIDLVREANAVRKHNENLKLVECPKCTHQFDAHGDKYQEYNFILSDEAEIRVGGRDEIVLRGAEYYLRDWNKFISLTPQPVPDLSKQLYMPSLLPHIELLERLANEGFDAEKVAAELATGSETYKTNKERLRERIHTKKQQESVLKEYEAQVKAYQKYVEVKNNHAAELEKLKDVELEIVSVKESYSKLRLYSEEVAKYNTKMEAQAEAVQIKMDLELNLDMLGRVKKSLSELKPKVKMHLLPSLNRVSSHLLSQMTDGERTKIEVNEDFDITVDGQPVETLSGSGKAVANLAVRIGLGTVLTNKVFSVFLADEIDAAMDDERAAHTAECLKNLTKTFKQIILVSHKQPEADHQIIL